MEFMIVSFTLSFSWYYSVKDQEGKAIFIKEWNTNSSKSAEPRNAEFIVFPLHENSEEDMASSDGSECACQKSGTL